MNLREFTSFLGAPGYQEGLNDLLAIVRDNPRETNLKATAAQISARHLMMVSSFNMKLEQKAIGDIRFAGEGADPQSLRVQTSKIRANVKMPLFAPFRGWVDPAFALLWEQARYAYWGTATAVIGALLSPTSSPTIEDGATYILTDNIADFAGLVTPFTARIISPPDDSEVEEDVVVTQVVKNQGKLILAQATEFPHATTQQIVVRPATTAGPLREPAFSLFSAREGMFSPCLVNKISIEAKAEEEVSITVELASLGIYRDRQPDIFDNKDALLAAFAAQSKGYYVYGADVKLSPAAAHNGTFGLATAIGSPLFAGFQTLHLSPVVITGFTLTIDNNLKELYAMNSLTTGGLRQRENSMPWALYSAGRTISGTITYHSPLDAWAVIERLAGPSSLANGGLILDCGVCRLTLSELAWEPATDAEAEDEQTRTLHWTMVAEGYNDMPELEYSTRI